MNNKGFSLVELLAVIVLLGIIALVAVPAVGKIQKDSREKIDRTNNDTILNGAYDCFQQRPSILCDSDDTSSDCIQTGESSEKRRQVCKKLPTSGSVTEPLDNIIKAGYIKDDTVDSSNNPYFGSGYSVSIYICLDTNTCKSIAAENENNSKYFNNYLFVLNKPVSNS